MVNIRTKGQTGEREVADKLNAVVNRWHELATGSLPPKPIVQRNQNQSAVGGSDLTNPFGLCIEIKRQEALSINTWWKQVKLAADEEGGIPILMFRQSRAKWRVMMEVALPLDSHTQINEVRGEISLDDFLFWFDQRVKMYYDNL